jgi:hypothetical protein
VPKNSAIIILPEAPVLANLRQLIRGNVFCVCSPTFWKS